MKNFGEFVTMFAYGLTGIQFYNKKNYGRHIRGYCLPTTQKRWANIGKRFYNAFLKVTAYD